MTNLCLLDFSKEDNLNKFIFESCWIKQLSFEEEEIFEYKEKLTIKRKPKKDKLVFIVIEEIFHKIEEYSYADEVEFKTEETAIDFFNNQKEQLLFFENLNKEKKVFDGRRYFFKINEKNEVLERCL